MSDNPQTFRARAERAARYIEDRHGEPLTAYRGDKPEGMGQAQLIETSATPIRGRFNRRALNVVMGHKDGKGAPTAVQVSSTHTEIKVTLATLSGMPWRLRVGCFVRRDIEDELYEVTNIMPKGVASAVLTLNLIGLPSILSGLKTARADVTVATGKGF